MCDTMDLPFETYLPVWNKLTAAQRQQISGSTARRTVKKGTILHNGSMTVRGC